MAQDTLAQALELGCGEIQLTLRRKQGGVHRYNLAAPDAHLLCRLAHLSTPLASERPRTACYKQRAPFPGLVSLQV